MIGGITMFSTHCQYDYPIKVLVPKIEAPAEGFPVLFVLDGQRYSDMIYSVMENQIRNSPKTKVDPFIIVSIGHQEDNVVNRRFYDFTAPAEKYTFPIRRGKKMQEVPAGGALNFKNFIKEELIPYVRAQYAVNSEQFYLYGHSLGGLFTLWTYLTDPQLFTKYVAISPSIWWNNHELLQQLQQASYQNLPPLAIYVGGEEGDMVDDAMTFYNNQRSSSTITSFYIALKENHASVIPTTISKALRFLCQK